MTGLFVPYILGVPSVRAEVIGEVDDCYVLRQEYDLLNERGEWEHVIKDYYREKEYIRSYWIDVTGLPCPKDDTNRVQHIY